MDIQSWMDLFLKELQSVFESRLVFVGLQGSRGRGEGRPDSDIDAVVVLDRLTPADLDAYEGLLDRLPNRELVCGFVSGRQELAAWERSELFQFARDTRPWLGSLDEILRLHDRSLPMLGELYKQAGFLLQAKHFLETGEDLTRPRELLPRLGEEDRTVLEGRERAAALSGPETPEFCALCEALISWSSRLIQEYAE